jgi:putative ABC transport system permease protein
MAIVIAETLAIISSLTPVAAGFLFGGDEMHSIWQDVRYGARMLLKQPTFTLVAIVTLALGIGANTAIFSIINAVLLRPFAYQDPERLVVVWESQLQRAMPRMFASPPNYADWREHQTVFDNLAAFAARDFALRRDDEPLRVVGQRATASLFSVLQAKPLLGRVFTEEEDKPGRGQVVVLSHALWRDRFGADPDLLNKSLTLDDQSFTVIGVMPPDFNFPPPIHLEGRAPDQKSELWVPFAMDMRAGQRGGHFMKVIARLKPGVSVERATSEMETIARQIEAGFPETNSGWSATVVGLSDQVLGESRPQLLALLAAVGFVLLIACVNVANLLIARGSARQKEFAVRIALGASRGRIIRQLMAESLLLAIAGGVAGLALAAWAKGLLISIAPRDVPRLDEASIDPQVVAFTVGVSILTGLLFGAAPAYQCSSTNLNRWLKEGGRSAAQGAARHRLRSGLIIAEVALSLVLLAGAGLLFQSFLKLRGIESGLRPEKVLTLRLSLPQLKYNEGAQRIAAYREIEQRLKSLPEIESAGMVLDVPLAADRQGTSLQIEGAPPPEPGKESNVNFTFVTPGYFRSMGVPVVAGRGFTDQDSQGSPNIVIVNAALARQFFPNEDPIGKRIFPGFNSQTAREVVGVVGDVRHSSLRDDPRPCVYIPYYQVAWSRNMSLVVRGRVEPGPILQAVRREAREVVPTLPLYDVKSLDDVLSDSLAQPRFSTLMLAVFSGVALLLASVGIYGFVSFLVIQRTHEIGVRMALGANRKDIFRMILGRGLWLALIGIVVGLGATLALTRLISSLLFDVSPTDPLTLATTAAALLGVVLAACFVPARRATRVDPMVALRCE